MTLEPRRLQGNAILALDDPRSAWLVEQGSFALFAVITREGIPAGPRRFLFTVASGEMLFGLPAPQSAAERSIVAVALEESIVRSVVRPAGDGSIEAPETAAWVARFKWLTGADAVSAPSLQAFHETLVLRLRELDREEDAHETTRLREQQRQSREAATEALEELAAVVTAERNPPTQGSALFMAASAVARHQGMTLTRPVESVSGERSGDPVEPIARTSHVRVRRVLLHDHWWQQDCGPLLAFQGLERAPVALLPGRSGGYRLLDPGRRIHVVVDAALASTLDPQVCVFYRPLPEQPAQGLALLKFALHGRGRDLAIVLGCSTLATLLGMFTPQALALIVDRAIPDGDHDLLWHIAFGLAAAALGAAVFRFSQGIAMMRIETAADNATQSAVWDRLLSLQLSFFRRFSTGDLQSRVSAISEIRSYLGGTTLRTLFSSMVLLLNLGLLLYYSVPLALVALGVALVSCSVTVLSGVLILRRARALLELRGYFFGLMVQLINGVAKLRVAAAEERAFTRWARDYTRLLRLELSQRRIEDVVSAINVAISTLSTIAVFAIAAALIRSGEVLSTGAFLAFNVAYGTFIGAIVSLSNTVTSVMAIAILRERARPILEALPEVTERKTHPGRLKGRLELSHLTFRYREDGPAVLDDLSLSVEPNRFVALIGPSGGGKSTIFRLLLGFETPQSGSVYYDGQDLSGLDVYAIRRQMGVVLQNGRITAGSLFENIVTGAHLSFNEAWEAARACGFDEEIKAMPMGMHTVVSEGGTNLSGGQRQRLLLSRALVHKPVMLLLDEATSALDNQTQSIVSESLRRLDVTRVVIAHRLSTVRGADHIYVIDGGRIAQSGSFDELARQEGLFARLMARQLA